MVWSKGQRHNFGGFRLLRHCLDQNFVRKGLNELNKKSNPWISIIACLVVQLCVGILYLWSAFKGNIVAAFSVGMDETAAAAVSSAATMVSSYMIFAFVFGNLIGGFLNDKKGPKFTCFAGVILFSAGIAISAFVKTIALLDLTYAIMAGLGLRLRLRCVHLLYPEVAAS